MNPELEQPLTISVEQDQGMVVLALVGELDPQTAPLLTEQIEAVRARSDFSETVVLDLSGITFVDSSGLRVWIDAQKAMTADERRLVFRHPSPHVARLLEITGLMEQFEVIK